MIFVIFLFLFCNFHNIHHSCVNCVVIFSSVRTQASGAIFYTVAGILVAASTVFSQTVKRTIAEQAAEGFRVCTGMAGKIFTFTMLEKIIIRHNMSPK